MSNPKTDIEKRFMTTEDAFEKVYELANESLKRNPTEENFLAMETFHDFAVNNVGIDF